MREILDKIFGWMDAAEFGIPVILALLVVAVGPLLATFYFCRAQHFVAAAVSFGLWVFAAAACIRDLRRRHFGWVTITLGVIWLGITLLLWWTLAAA